MSQLNIVKFLRKHDKSVFLALCSLLSLSYFYWLVIWQAAFKMPLPDGSELVAWQSRRVFELRWLIAFAGILIVIICAKGQKVLKINHSSFACDSKPEIYDAWRRAMALLPFASIVILFADFFPVSVVTNTVFFIPIAALSLVVTALYHSRRRFRYKLDNGVTLFIVCAILYSWLGYNLAIVTGEHVGDEAHYLIQARSLYEDGDLDIKNNILDKASTEEERTRLVSLRKYMHIAPNCKADHWYSYHPYGLPLLLAPIWGMGMIARYIFLGIVGALGSLAAYMMCRIIRVGKGSAFTVVILFSFSVYWAIYSARALPEMLGATMLAWIFFNIFNQKNRPWKSALICAVLCGYLPAVHERFIPLSLMGFGFYGLTGLVMKKTWKSRILRLGVFSILTFMIYGLIIMSQFIMFENGMKFSVKNALFSYPMGIWGIIVDSRGLLSVLPSFMWIAAASLLWPLASKEQRAVSFPLLITFLVCLVTSCCNTVFQGGSCIPGRYLLVATPLLLPAASYMFENTNRAARWWYVFLALVSFAILLLSTICLKEIGRGFILPLHNLAKCNPLLAGLLHPHASFLPAPGDMAHIMVTLYAACGIVLSAWLICAPADKIKISYFVIPLIIVLAVSAHSVQPQKTTIPESSPKMTAHWLKNIYSGNAFFQRINGKETVFTDIACNEFSDVKHGSGEFRITTQDLGSRIKERTVSQPRLEKNDWMGRDKAWTTLTKPHKPLKGITLLHIKAEVTGTVSPVLALHEGKRTILEETLETDKDGRIKSNIIFESSGDRGHLYILMRLENGEGALTLNSLSRTPFNSAILKDTDIRLTGQTINSTEPDSKISRSSGRNVQ